MSQHVPPAEQSAVEEPARIVGIEAHLKGHRISAALREWSQTGTLSIAAKPDSLWAACEIHEVVEEITDAAVAKEYGASMVRRAAIRTPAHSEDAYTDPQCGDIYWSAGTWAAAKTAAAAAIAATQAAISTSNISSHSPSPHHPCHAFCIVRPPGHHCFNVPTGFCFLNNVVLAAKTALAANKRVAILDWDYHFGDGTAAALGGHESVMFVSLHAAFTRAGFPTYPAPKGRNWKGEGLAKATGGRSFNVQWPTDNADDAAYAYAFQHVILPALERFAPDVILVSAGYDALRGDDLAGMELTPAAFGFMAAALTRLQKPIVAVLEGGYNVHLLAEGVAETIRGLRGEAQYTGDHLAAWLDQEPVAVEHREVVDALVGLLGF